MDFLPLVMSSGVDASGADMFRAAKTARIGARLARLVRVLRIIRVLKLFVQARGMKKGQVHEDEAEKEDEGAPSELSKALQGQITKKTIVFVLALLGSQVVIDFIPYAGVDIANLGDSRARLGMAQLFGAIGNGTTPSELNTDFQVKIREQFRAIIQSKLLLTSAFFPQVYTPLFRLDIYVFNSTGHETGVITYWPVPGQQSTVSPDNSLLIDATSQTYHTDPSTFSSLTGEPGMPAWVPSWPYADSNWPNCEFRCLDTVANNCINDCPNARGTQAAMRDLRVIGPPEILQLPFVVDDDLAAMMGRPELMGKQVIRIWFGTKAAEDIQAGMSIILIICITILLGLMGFLLSRDVDKMVIRPIESMVSDVTKLAANPAYRLEEVKEIKYETDALKMSLGKIATMLQVGFGEAGNNLVAENLKKGDTVDPMVPGRKLLGAYGFCIIDEYEEVLECLGEEILPFTNTAAKVVHDAVSENGGQPNRNLGEAFLCVWKPDYGEDTEQTISPANLEYAETKMCDGALTAFRRCVRGISMSGPLQAYNNHDEIVKFFDGTYTTRIGYGLHYGWAIEGAVGTNIKIDCSYLSPNVNLAARLESATKMYGVNVLMSESFRDKLSPSTQGGLRRVDVVCLKGSSIPMAIYTCDRSNAIYVAQRAIDKYGTDKVVTEFQRIFEEGMDEFVAGNWQASKGFFETALTICPRDIPSQRILMHMDTPENHPDYGLATTPFNAPEGWPGYHILLSK
jgi:class 3 adenylate cyclase